MSTAAPSHRPRARWWTVLAVAVVSAVVVVAAVAAGLPARHRDLFAAQAAAVDSSTVR